MIIYAIVMSASDRAGFWAGYQTVYRLCKTEDEARNMLRMMDEKTMNGLKVENGYYSSPELSSDGKTLKLLYHDEFAVSHYVNWEQIYNIVIINNAEELLKDSPF